MGEVICTACGTPISAEDVNVRANVAYCRRCGIAHVVSRLAGADAAGEEVDARLTGVDPLNPPRGAWYRDDGVEVRVGASARSIGGALGGLFVALFWNGIVSVFVALATAGTLQQAGVTAPAWFPAPKMNGQPMSAWMVVGLWLFLVPFILIGLAIAGAAAVCIAGRCEVVIRGGVGRAFTGVAGMGWNRRFDAAGVRRVSIGESKGRRNSEPQEVIRIESERETISFGSPLSEPRRAFVAGVLSRVLVRGQSTSTMPVRVEARAST